MLLKGRCVLSLALQNHAVTPLSTSLVREMITVVLSRGAERVTGSKMLISPYATPPTRYTCDLASCVTVGTGMQNDNTNMMRGWVGGWKLLRPTEGRTTSRSKTTLKRKGRRNGTPGKSPKFESCKLLLAHQLNHPYQSNQLNPPISIQPINPPISIHPIDFYKMRFKWCI